jgi:hypothetical protein
MTKLTRAEVVAAFADWCQSEGVGANKVPKQASESGKESESISVAALKRRTTSTNQPPAPPQGFDSWVEYTAYIRAWPLRKIVAYYTLFAWWMVILTAHTLTARPLSWSELAILVVAIPPRLQCWAFALAMAVRCLGGPQPFLPWLVDLIRAS